MFKPLLATACVLVGSWNPAHSVESLRASEFTLICNDNPASLVFAVLESKSGSFMGFDKNGRVSYAASMTDTPRIVGTWESIIDTPHVSIISKQGVRTNILNLYTQKCDEKYSF